MHNSKIDSIFQNLFLLKYPLGPHFFDGHLTPAYYRDFRETEKLHSLEVVPLAKEGRIWTKHDRKPLHFGRSYLAFVRQF
jgi:hypothetical protein